MGELYFGTTFYVDFDRMRKHGGYVYWWHLIDHLTPSETGIWSHKVYNQGDCKLFRSKSLSTSAHKAPMGGGTIQLSKLDEDWKYPPPDSMIKIMLKSVCSR